MMNLPRNLYERFQAIVNRHPDLPAIRYAGKKNLSYAALARMTGSCVAYMKEVGVKRGDLVGLFHDKSPEAFATQMACLYLGLPYVCLDPDSPPGRLNKILDTCRPSRIFDFCAVEGFSERDYPVDVIGDSNTHIFWRSIDQPLPPSGANGSIPAYVMFTSGSTGRPKGAVISHANVLHFIRWTGERFKIGPNDTLTSVNPMFFDNSVFDFYAALFNGACLAPFTGEEVREPLELVRAVEDRGCTLWFSTPSLLIYLLTLRALTKDSWSAMRSIIFGGEGFPKPKLRNLYEFFGDRVSLVNVYGPTECTCICSSHEVTADDVADPTCLAPLGYLNPEFDYVIQPVEPKGKQPLDTSAKSGELVLLGSNVGLGYYRDPERTAEAFVQNPKRDHFRDIGYRTGDIVEEDEFGMLHFKGRIDFQIKHMGYRIELEEIESVLHSMPGVMEAAVVYRSLDEGMGEIVAHVAMECDTRSMGALRSELRAQLPQYMLPKRICTHQFLPKNANGKIDRIALLNPEFMEKEANV